MYIKSKYRELNDRRIAVLSARARKRVLADMRRSAAGVGPPQKSRRIRVA